MYTVIFGRPGCPYCVRAKELAEKLKNERDDFDYRYIDIHAEGISKEDLSVTVGKPVETVPQILSMKSTSAAALISKLTRKPISVCSAKLSGRFARKRLIYSSLSR